MQHKKIKSLLFDKTPVTSGACKLRLQECQRAKKFIYTTDFLVIRSNVE